jgi:hypothetical protein
MKNKVSRSEAWLLAALVLAVLLACVGPHVAQYAHYHAFADQRTVAGLPFAMDVLSNLPFAVAGVWGLAAVARVHRLYAPCALDARWALAVLFFVGLLLTTVGSIYYHLQPGDLGLAWDRTGMVVAFAGLLGMAAADRVSPRAGVVVAVAVLLGGPMAVLVWLLSGNLLPWVVVQGGGMVLVVVLALRAPVVGAWRLPLAAVIAWYAVAKLLELGDHQVYAWTQGLVSGHTLKHVAAALAAWPVIRLMHNGTHLKKA